MEGPDGEPSEATGIPAAELDAILESIANKGLVMDLPYAGTGHSILTPGLIGFMELTFMRRRRDLPVERLARLMTEYLHEKGRAGEAGEFSGSRTPITRALVYKQLIPVRARRRPTRTRERSSPRATTARSKRLCRVSAAPAAVGPLTPRPRRWSNLAA
jgi:hypothetical protein